MALYNSQISKEIRESLEKRQNYNRLDRMGRGFSAGKSNTAGKWMHQKNPWIRVISLGSVNGDSEFRKKWVLFGGLSPMDDFNSILGGYSMYNLSRDRYEYQDYNNKTQDSRTKTLIDIRKRSDFQVVYDANSNKYVIADTTDALKFYGNDPVLISQKSGTPKVSGTVNGKNITDAELQRLKQEWDERITQEYTNQFGTPTSTSVSGQIITNRPGPGITQVSIQNKGSMGSTRECTINFVCWDIAQLNALEMLYMTPGISLLIEWGWNLDIDGNVIDINMAGEPPVFDYCAAKKIIENSLLKGGHYDAMQGPVVNFDWKLRQDGGFDCSTTIVSIADTWLDINIHSKTKGAPTLTGQETTNEATEENILNTIKQAMLQIGAPRSYGAAYTKRYNIEVSDDSYGVSGILKTVEIQDNPITISNRVITVNEQGKEIVFGFGTFLTDEQGGVSGTFADLESEKTELSDTEWENFIEDNELDANFPADDSSAVIYVTWGWIEDYLISANLSFTTDSIRNSCNLKNLDLDSPAYKEDGEKYLLNGKFVFPRLCSKDSLVGNSDWLISTDPRICVFPWEKVTRRYKKALEVFAPDRTGMNHAHIREIMINLKYVYNCFKNSNTLTDFLKTMLSGISKCSGDAWDLGYIIDEDKPHIVQCVDFNYKGKPTFLDVENTLKPYMFEVYTEHCIVRDVDLSTEVSQDLKAMVMYGTNKQDGDAYSNANIPVKEEVDRFNFYGVTVRNLGGYEKIRPLRYNEVSNDKPENVESKIQLPPALRALVDYSNGIKLIYAAKDEDLLYPADKFVDYGFLINIINTGALETYEGTLSVGWDYITSLFSDKITDENTEMLYNGLSALNKGFTVINDKTHNWKNSIILPIKLSITIDGLSGIKFGNLLDIDYKPARYNGRVCFMVTNVSHNLSVGDWTTTIETVIQVIPNKDEMVKYYLKKKAPATHANTWNVLTLPSSQNSGKYPPPQQGRLSDGTIVENGNIPDTNMKFLRGRSGIVNVPANTYKLESIAADKLEALLDSYEKFSGAEKININSTYRTYAGQVEQKEIWTSKGKPQNASTPGRSKHGWGQAVDIGDMYGARIRSNHTFHKFVHEFGAALEWTHPNWAHANDTEPWHFEYVGVNKVK